MDNDWHLIILAKIVILFIAASIYKSYQKKKKAQQEELNKIKAYGESINEQTRNKH
tara:strand:- start:120 stop:287 length:168 start_codon:yes stop_codon:yes gene_type:complete